MASNTPIELVEYYQGLLIAQYLNKAKASATIGAYASQVIMAQVSVQTIAFSSAPASGTFVLSYNGVNTAAINWNDSAGTIQTKLRAVTGLGSVTVAGSIAGLLLTVTFTGVIAPALMLVNVTNSLAVTLTIAETDVTLPLAVQDGFNLIDGSTIAVGDQLDVLGKYVGVSRTGLGFTENITLDDSDFLQLIRMAITTNSSGSSLSTIQDFLQLYFPSEIFVFDYQNMQMTYIISRTVGSQDLVQLFVTEGLLPQPMAVGITVFYPPTANLFSFRTYTAASVTGEPFNNYTSYQTTWPWLQYEDLVTP